MKIRSTFHTFVLMVTPLMFSMSSVTLAQQNSLRVEARAASVKQDAKLMNLEIKAAAEQDANSDVNKLLWFGTGAGLATVGCAVGACAGCIVGSIINPETDDFFFNTAQYRAGIRNAYRCRSGGLAPARRNL